MFKTVRKDVVSAWDRSFTYLRRNSGSWDDNVNLMKGNISSKSRNTLAEAYGQLRSLKSAILAGPPQVFFEAKREIQRAIAAFLTDAVNYDFKVGDLRSILDKALWMCFAYGLGPIAEQVETEYIYDKKGEIIDIKGQRYSWVNINPRDILFDPDGIYTNLSDHRYIFMAHYKSVTELRGAEDEKGEKIYRNLTGIEYLPAANAMGRRQGGYIVDSRMGIDSTPFSKISNPDFHQIKIWRMYDRPNTRLVEMTDSEQRIIRESEWPTHAQIRIDGVLQYPVKLLAMNTEPDKFYPIAEVELIRSQLVNLLSLNDQMMADATSKKRKYVFMYPWIDKTQAGQLLDEKHPNQHIMIGEEDIATYEAMGVPKITAAKDVAFKLDDIMVDPQVPGVMQEIRSQIYNIMAYGPASRAGIPQIRSAKEAGRIASAAEAAIVARRVVIEEYVADLGLYHALVIKAISNPDAKRWVRMTDKSTGLALWHQYSPADIPNEEDLFCDCYAGSSSPQTLDTKRDQSLKLANIMIPILMKLNMDPTPFLYDIAEKWGIKNFDVLMRNHKGAMMELLGILVQSGKKPLPPDLLLKGIQNVLDTGLDKGMQQLVIKSMQEQGGDQGSAPPGMDVGPANPNPEAPIG